MVAAAGIDRLARLFDVRLPTTPAPRARPVCPVLEFAASGAMWLTGHRAGPPVALQAPVIPHAAAACAGLARVSERVGRRVSEDAPGLLTGRAAHRDFRRAGPSSVNGSCRLLRAADGWIAVNLPRPSDLELLPAVVGGAVSDPWVALTDAAGRLPAHALAARAQLVGIAAAPLGTAGPTTPDPFVVRALGPAAPDRRAATRTVVDFSAMWAGPLCAHLLGRAGAAVVTVEDPDRPDGARAGDPLLHTRLHRGHRLASVRFTTGAGVDRIHRLVDGADIVIESSRPRALAQIGLSPERFLTARPGRTWVSITGHGRSGPREHWVGFGDDTAVAGGLVAWSDGSPVFCADAIADPLSGLYAAFGALLSVAAGGGHAVEVSMRACSAYVLQGPQCGEPHPVVPDPVAGWIAAHGGEEQPVVPPPRRLAA